jgi:hypothetical protein
MGHLAGVGDYKFVNRERTGLGTDKVTNPTAGAGIHVEKRRMNTVMIQLRTERHALDGAGLDA